MISNIKIIARVALFAALVFVFSYMFAFFPNINPAFFVVFTAGFLWGVFPGVLTGIVGYFVYSIMSPYGPGPFPILIAQLVGISFSALLGQFYRKFHEKELSARFYFLLMGLFGLLSGLLYHLPVDIVDAWLYRPFWPRLIGGLIFSLITIGSNIIIFTILKPVIDTMDRYERLNLR